MPSRNRALQQQILLASQRSLAARDRFTENQVKGLTDALAEAEGNVKRALLRYRSLDNPSSNKLAAFQGLGTLQKEITSIIQTLKKDQSLRFRKALTTTFRLGVSGGVDVLVQGKWPQFQNLGKAETAGLAQDLYNLVDRDALDFMTRYSLTLAGEVGRETLDGIKRTLLTAIVNGTGVTDIVRDLGRVVRDPDAFRNAGSKVFSKAQYRMALIARTELLRAHNQGRLQFHRTVGVDQVQWLTLDDERVCPQCGPLDDKRYDLDDLPNQPLHPLCRCSHVIAVPATLLTPDQLKKKASRQRRERREANRAFDHGTQKDLAQLNRRQLEMLGKDQGVSNHRTKKEQIRQLEKKAPGTVPSGLSGGELNRKLREHHIGRQRSKEELVRHLRQKQKILKEKRQTVETLKANPASALERLSVDELKELARKSGVSPYFTKAEVIETLNERNPDVDHSKLSKEALLNLRRKFGLGRHKTKRFLIQALEKVSGNKLAEGLVS